MVQTSKVAQTSQSVAEAWTQSVAPAVEKSNFKSILKSFKY